MLHLEITPRLCFCNFKQMFILSFSSAFVEFMGLTHFWKLNWDWPYANLTHFWFPI